LADKELDIVSLYTKFGLDRYIYSEVVEGVSNFKFMSHDPNHAHFRSNLSCNDYHLMQCVFQV